MPNARGNVFSFGTVPEEPETLVQALPSTVFFSPLSLDWLCFCASELISRFCPARRIPVAWLEFQFQIGGGHLSLYTHTHTHVRTLYTWLIHNTRSGKKLIHLRDTWSGNVCMYGIARVRNVMGMLVNH